MTSDNDPITLKDAASHFGFTVSTLRAEAGRGNLVIYRIGKRLYTTRKDMVALIAKIGPKPRILGKPLSELLFMPAGIYVIGFDQFVKIGWSGNVEKRLLEIQQGVPQELQFYGYLEGGVPGERMLHRRFAEYRTRGEWFRREGEIADWINRGCQR